MVRVSAVTEVYTRLSNHAGLTALTTEIYPYDPPQGTPMPRVLYSKVDSTPEHAMGSDPGVAHTLFEIRIEADDPLEVENVAVQVKAAMDRWSSSTGSVAIQESLREYEFSSFEYVGETDTKVYFQEIGFMVHHGE